MIAAARPAVLVLQTGVRSAPWTCRSLAAAGYRVLGGHDGSSGSASGRSRHCPAPLRYPSPSVDPDGFLSAVEATCRREAVTAVMPLTESTLHLLVDQLPAPGGAALVGPNHRQYEALCAKDGLARTAAAAGVHAPRSVPLTPAGPSSPLPALPNVVKPLSSAVARPGEVVYRPAQVVRSLAERERVLDGLLQDTGGALVEEYLGGRQWLVDFARSSGGLTTLTRAVSRTYPRDAGMPSVQRILAATPTSLEDAVRRLLEAVDYRGIGQVQFLERDGVPCVHDVNLRIVYGVAAPLRAGLDLPCLGVEVARGTNPSLPRGPFRPGRYVWLGGEGRALLDALGARARPDRVLDILRDVVAAGASPSGVLDQAQLWDPRRVADTIAWFLRHRIRK